MHQVRNSESIISTRQGGGARIPERYAASVALVEIFPLVDASIVGCLHNFSLSPLPVARGGECNAGPRVAYPMPGISTIEFRAPPMNTCSTGMILVASYIPTSRHKCRVRTSREGIYVKKNSECTIWKRGIMNVRQNTRAQPASTSFVLRVQHTLWLSTTRPADPRGSNVWLEEPKHGHRAAKLRPAGKEPKAESTALHYVVLPA